MKKKILVCGATGFIGKNLARHFSINSDHDVRAVYFNRAPDKAIDAEWVFADLRKSEDVSRVVEGVDIILQYAATTSGAKDIVSKPYIHVTDNAVINSLMLRESFERNIEHFVFPSCSIMYQPGSAPVSEDNFSESDEVYPKYYGAGNTKVYLEKMCNFFSRFDKRTKYTVLRQSNIYGPYDKFDLEKSHVFGATITKVMQSDQEIVVWGTGKEERDFLHVTDLIKLIEECLEKQENKFELVNASFGESVSIDSLVKKVVQISEKTLDIKYNTSMPTIPTKLAVDNTRARSLFGWQPEISLEAGIKNTIEWYRENLC